ncbi:hypothetical protein B7W85_06080 [Allorhizobium ampelinum]|nr:hypothetical protein [Allorhizobium ampelinum]OVE95389.1 hypothetical protein B7W85_06080 [Allorhizobium ampelinum]
MAGKPQHWKERNGRYSARVVIPPQLRPYLDNRAELEIQLAALRAVIADTEFLSNQLETASLLISPGLVRCWKPRFQREA